MQKTERYVPIAPKSRSNGTDRFVPDSSTLSVAINLIGVIIAHSGGGKMYGITIAFLVGIVLGIGGFIGLLRLLATDSSMVVFLVLGITAVNFFFMVCLLNYFF